MSWNTYCNSYNDINGCRDMACTNVLEPMELKKLGSVDEVISVDSNENVSQNDENNGSKSTVTDNEHDEDTNHSVDNLMALVIVEEKTVTTPRNDDNCDDSMALVVVDSIVKEKKQEVPITNRTRAYIAMKHEHSKEWIDAMLDERNPCGANGCQDQLSSCDLDKEIYMEHPEGFLVQGRKTTCVGLQKMFDGLKQAPSSGLGMMTSSAYADLVCGWCCQSVLSNPGKKLVELFKCIFRYCEVLPNWSITFGNGADAVSWQSKIVKCVAFVYNQRHEFVQQMEACNILLWFESHKDVNASEMLTKASSKRIVKDCARSARDGKYPHRQKWGDLLGFS
ncbi:hypothetical protein Tco_0450675 [Tanacetum coccineum]